MKRRSVLKSFSIGLTALLAGAVAGTIAWFHPIANLGLADTPIEGATAGAYFAYGDGNSGTPYGISKPRHLYNLAWLTYLGFFKDKQTYFELANDIDMDGWVLPPIGTAEYPFIGQFDGNDFIVSNSTVSNSFADYGNKHPGAVTQSSFNANIPNIVGFFGVIGNYPGNSCTVTYDSSINTASDFGLSDVNVTTYSANTLVGMVAGYVSADISNIAVDTGNLSIATGAGTSTISPATKISEHAILGYTTKTKNIQRVDETIYAVDVSQDHEFNATDQGETTGWGGSIDMKSVTKRLQTIRSTITPSTNWPYKRTYKYHDGVREDTYTTDARGTGSRTYIKADNDEIGHFNFIQDNDGTDDQYALLGGGHYQTNQNYITNVYTGRRITDGTHYLTVSTYGGSDGASSGTLSSTTNEASARVWTVPQGSSGYISTRYYYNDGNTAYDYYLYNNNGTLQLSRGDNYRTTWYVDADEDGNLRYRTSNNYDGYYLTFSNNAWRLSRFETRPTAPTAPGPAPTAPTKEPYPTEPAYYNKGQYQLSNYQIYYVSGGQRYYLNFTNSNMSVSTSPSRDGWQFSDLPGTSTIRAGSSSYYLRYSRNGRYTYTYTPSLGSTMDWTIQTSGSGYRVYQNLATSSSWLSSKSNFYLTLSTGGISMSTTEATLQIVNTSDELDDLNSLHDDWVTECQEIDEAYAIAVGKYNQDLDKYNQKVAEYEEAMEIYNTVTIPAYEARIAVEGHIIKPTQETTFRDEGHEHLNNTTGGMNYDDDDVTYFPLNTMNNTSDFRPSDTNTAYIIGGSNITQSTASYKDVLTNVRFGRYAISGNISSDFNVSTGKFTNIYTVNNSLNRERIPDNTTAYEKLDAAKTNLGKVLKDDRTYVYGLHFMRAPISKDATTYADYMKANRQVYEDYELPVNSIDFHLKEFGYINFMSGSYFTGNSEEDPNDSFFSLYQIERVSSAPKQINRILKIEEIYQHGSKAKNYSYVYKLKDMDTGNIFYTKPYKVIDVEGNREWIYDTTTPYSENQYVNTLPDNYVSIFKVARIEKNNIAENTFIKHVYYFEIPMNDGEFCLGAVDGGSGSYLMYLDIGANAAKTQRTIISERFLIDRDTFVCPVGVAFMPYNDSGIDDTDSASMTVPTGFAGKTLTVSRSGNALSVQEDSVTTLTGDLTYLGDSLTIADNIKEKLKPKLTESTEIRRLQYYDYNVNLEAVTRTVITDTYANGATTPTRTVEQYKLNSDNTWSEIAEENWKIYQTKNGTSYDIATLKNPTSTRLDTPTDSGGLGWVNPGSTVALAIHYELGESVADDVVIDLVMVVDPNNTNGYYFMYSGYSLSVTATGGSYVVKVLGLGSGTISINGTTITSVGQTITINPA